MQSDFCKDRLYYITAQATWYIRVHVTLPSLSKVGDDSAGPLKENFGSISLSLHVGTARLKKTTGLTNFLFFNQSNHVYK
jgi:hypothetical protein